MIDLGACPLIYAAVRVLRCVDKRSRGGARTPSPPATEMPGAFRAGDGCTIEDLYALVPDAS